ncbi:SGNH/GDSL hydrolase family protein [Mesobacillus foraminis]|uniref:SGNH/GDSL hydrolase family protein n=1 Tax=Mesobacillus foraminis TaxID=279826 RepID=UPI000EF51503|nr:SGNH/GDSL hydrolase family protein [Mesobacillus foraminis]
MMKNLLVALLVIGCIAILIAGNIYWKERTTILAESSMERTVKETEQVAENNIDNEELIKFTKNWPVEAKEQYKLSLEQNRPFIILLAGSDSLGNETDGWSGLLKKSLEEKFEGTVKVAVKSYDLTSAEFIQEGKLKELVGVKPDMTLLEPFTLNDNGLVRIEDSHQIISQIAAGLLEENSEHVLMLQPSFPIYNAQYYPIQVEELKDYAKRNNFTFLDHWSTWPDADSEEIKEFLTENQESPNEKGHKLWADYLKDYLIAE